MFCTTCGPYQESIIHQFQQTDRQAELAETQIGIQIYAATQTEAVSTSTSIPVQP